MASGNRIAVIARLTDESQGDRLEAEFKRLAPVDGWRSELVTLRGKRGLAAICNEALRCSDARCKVYVDETARFIEPDLLRRVVDFFAAHPGCGLMGLYGSELPLSGDPARSHRRFGRHRYEFDQRTDSVATIGDNPLFAQAVHVVDDAFVATSRDLDWDEGMPDGFAVAAQCCRFRRQGLGVMVPMQDGDWLAFARPSRYSLYTPPESLAAFHAGYRDVICPLVSVLIPTCNQPGFFREALESALAQDYPNLEILVGDDSTDTRTRDLMQPYLARHAHLRYYYHGGPLGRHGARNRAFLAERAKGEYMNTLLHDDLMHPTRIRRMMEHYVADLDGEIGLITSSRNEIDASGRKLQRMNPWAPARDTLFSGADMARLVMSMHKNLIGEMTTVLLRRADLLQPDGKCATGVFCGVRDGVIGDVATFLEMFHRRPRGLFLADTLSSFRTHDGGQSSRDDMVQMLCAMDWVCYVATSEANRLFLRDEAEARLCYDRCLPECKWALGIAGRLGNPDEETRRLIDTLRQVHDAISAKDYDRVRRLAAGYTARHIYPDEEL